MFDVFFFFFPKNIYSKSTHISESIIEKCVKFTHFCSKTPHINPFAAVTVQIYMAIVALYLNILLISHFISLPHRLFFASLCLSYKPSHHFNPPPSQVTTHYKIWSSYHKIWSTHQPENTDQTQRQLKPINPNPKSNPIGNTIKNHKMEIQN